MVNLLELAAEVGDLLKMKNWQFCAAESCTGGLLLSTMTDVSGSSAYITGGVVSYSNEAKQQLLHVREETLVAYGAVSAETASEMVLGAKALFAADIAISITGIAGPSGGTPEKPVGLVYIGLASPIGIQVERYLWQGNRAGNKAQSVEAALKMLKTVLSAEKNSA